MRSAWAVGLAAAILLGCVPAGVRAETIQYACFDGVSFTATFRGHRVVIVTTSARYLLRRRGGSLERYGSASTAFIRDGEDAVLVGAAGGPYIDCRSAKRIIPASV